ncbi:hypothetical protein D3C81_1964790 [compost metagenome]
MAAVQDAEVEGQQGEDQRKEGQPQPGGGAENVGEKNSLQCVHDTLRTPTWRLSTVRGARGHLGI